MLFRIINTDLYLKGRIFKENSVIEMTDDDYQKEKNYFGRYLAPFNDDSKKEKIPEHPITLNTEQKINAAQVSDSKPKSKRGRRSKSSSV